MVPCFPRNVAVSSSDVLSQPMNYSQVQQRINHNSGFCDYEAKRTGNLKLSYLFGVGSESRGTPIAFESPYGLIVNDSDKWAVDLHAIDLRDTIDPLGCRECLCQVLLRVDQYFVQL